jgi:hypothetical protein
MTTPPTPSPPGPAPKGLAALVLLFGTGAVWFVGFVSLLLVSFAFDSPRRTTSSDLVAGLLAAGVGGETLAAWLVGAGLALRRARTPRGLVAAAVGVGAVAVLLHAAAIALALFGP